MANSLRITVLDGDETGQELLDLVMPTFGSIAGAESVLLAFDESFQTHVAMAEAPHGTAPALQGKDVANPMAMLLACGAVLAYAADRDAMGPSRPHEPSTRQSGGSGLGRADPGSGRSRKHLGVHV